MSQRTQTIAAPTSGHADLDRVLNEISERLMQGEAIGNEIDVEAYAAQLPDHADHLRGAIPGIQALVDLGHASLPDSADSAIRTPHSALPGVLGDFQIIREIGRGGMGVVYEAEQISLRRKVALKVLPFAGMLDARQISRFENEARAAATVHHTNVVPIHFVGSDRKVHFYAMQLIEGQSLAEAIAEMRDERQESRAGANDDSPTHLLTVSPTHRSPQSAIDTAAVLSTVRSTNPREYFRTVAGIGAQIAEALDHAHSQGVIHRDVKPANILIDEGGKPWITDFGLARIGTDVGITMSGDILGSLRYMSPEQASGNHGAVNHSTDIYSLGVTLYELATLRPAFQGGDRQRLLRQIALDGPKPSSRAAPSVPRDLETIILKAIAKDPGARFATAQDFSDDLKRFIELRPIVARRQSRLSRAVQWTRRNRAVASIAGLAFLLLLTLAIGGPIAAFQQRAAARKESQLVSQLEQFTGEQRASIYARDMSLVRGSISEGKHLEAERVLLDWVAENGAPDVRGFEWYYLWNSCHDPAIERTIRHELGCNDVAFSDGGKRLLVGWFSDVSVWDLTQPRVRSPHSKLLGHLGGGAAIYPLPREQRLLTGDGDGIVRLWDTVKNESLQVWQANLPSGQTAIHTLDATDDGRYWAVGTGSSMSGYVRVFNRAKDEFCPPIDDLPGAARCSFLSNDSLAVGCRESDRLLIYDCTKGTVVETLELTGDCRSLAVSADRNLLAVGTTIQRGIVASGRIEWGHFDQWRDRATVVLPCETVLAIAFSKDARLLAVGDTTGKLFLIDADSGKVLLQKQAHFEDIDAIEFSPDERLLATASDDGHVHLWRVADLLHKADHTVRELELETHAAVTSVFLDGGDRVATADLLGDIFIWEVETSEIVRTIAAPRDDVSMCLVAVSADGRYLAACHGYYPWNKDNRAYVEVHDLVGGQLCASVELPHPCNFPVPAFSPDGRFLALRCLGKEIVVVDVRSESIAWSTLFEDTVKSAAFSPDGKSLACGLMNGEVHYFDTATFQLDHVHRADPRMAESIQFSPDGSLFVATGMENSINLFETATGERTASFKKCPGLQTWVRFSPDGERLVSIGLDGMVRLWHVESGEEVLAVPFAAYGGWPSVEFAPSGRRIAITNGRKVTVLEAADPDNLASLSVAELRDVYCGHITEHEFGAERKRE